MPARLKTIQLTVAASALVLAAALSPGASLAQAPGMPATPGFTTKPIHVSPITGDDSKEIVIIAVSIAPGGFSPSHIHPGECAGTVIEGTLELIVEGKESRRLAAGEAFSNARGAVHQFKNAGDTPVRLVTTLVVDKGKPRTQPAPQR